MESLEKPPGTLLCKHCLGNKRANKGLQGLVGDPLQAPTPPDLNFQLFIQGFRAREPLEQVRSENLLLVDNFSAHFVGF